MLAQRRARSTLQAATETLQAAMAMATQAWVVGALQPVAPQTKAAMAACRDRDDAQMKAAASSIRASSERLALTPTTL